MSSNSFASGKAILLILHNKNEGKVGTVFE